MEWRCGIRDGKDKVCGRLLERPEIGTVRVFAAGYVDPGDSPQVQALCKKHGTVYAPEREILAAQDEGQAALLFWRLARRSLKM